MPSNGQNPSADAGFYSSAKMIEGADVGFDAGSPVPMEQIAQRFDEIIPMKDEKH